MGTNHGYFHSSNNGDLWDYRNLSDRYITKIIRKNGILFCGTDEGLYKSTDNGLNWNFNPLTYHDVGDLAVIGTRILAIAWSDTLLQPFLFHSTDDGATWSLTNPSMFGWGILYTTDVNIFKGAHYLYISTDLGNTWGVKLGYLIGAVSGKDNYIFANVDYGGPYVFFSTDKGYSWNPMWWNLVNEGLGNLRVRKLLAGNNYLFAGTDSGIWRRPYNEFVVGFKDEKRALNFNLYQNYPNSFNPSTIIKYSLPGREQVTLKVFDILGKEIALLVHEEKPAGEYEVQFNAANLSSGVYYYRLQTGSFIQTKKFILLR